MPLISDRMGRSERVQVGPPGFLHAKCHAHTWTLTLLLLRLKQTYSELPSPTPNRRFPIWNCVGARPGNVQGCGCSPRRTYGQERPKIGSQATHIRLEFLSRSLRRGDATELCPALERPDRVPG